METSSRTNAWIQLIGFILLLLGIYGSVRTAINLAAFERYPYGGIFSFGWDKNQMMMPIGPREADCAMMSPSIYYDAKGTARDATGDEKKQAEQYKQSCLDGARESRENAKINDISQSLLFLFLGAGVLLSRRVFKVS